MRTVLASVALLAITPLVFAAGGREGAARSGPALSPPGTYPIVEQPYSFTAVAYYSSSTSTGNPDDVWFADYIADLTNVRIDFVEMIEANNAQERFNLILASGDLPELLIPHSTLTAQQVFTHGRNGTFLALNDLIDQRMPEYKQRLAEEPEVADRLTMPDGNIYSTVDLEANCFHCQYSVKMWLYKPWMDKLGLAWPETTEDFYNVLKAFKTRDPNGNGRADEVPLIGATTSWRTDPFGFLMNSFVELHKRMDKLGGAEREMTDQQRLQEGFDQAQRDLETLDNADISGEQAGELFRFVNSTMGGSASPHEKVRAAIFMRAPD